MSNVPILGSKPVDKKKTFRLLHCWVCDTLEELPPFEGPAEHDNLLAVACERHVFESGEPHKGNLFVDIPIDAWRDSETRRDAIRQIRQGGSKGLAEIDDKFYESRSIFMDDAMKCWKQHLSPKDGCPDFHSSEKMLVPKTQAERKEAGLDKFVNTPGPKTYLCDFCPVAVAVAQRKRKIMGLE